METQIYEKAAVQTGIGNAACDHACLILALFILVASTAFITFALFALALDQRKYGGNGAEELLKIYANKQETDRLEKPAEREKEKCLTEMAQTKADKTEKDDR